MVKGPATATACRRIDPDLEQFLDGVKLLLKKSGLKQKALAAFIGVSPSYLSQILGKTHGAVPFAVCLSMARFFNASIEQVLAVGTGREPPPAPVFTWPAPPNTP